ncbi:MAG: site-2 protease family protein [Chloroflexi bacterium]|nr:site-2 protease family protein [Chloroflexota bacterium]
MGYSIKIGKIAGIPIGIHWSWFIVFVLVLVTLAAAFFPAVTPGLSITEYWVMAFFTTLFFFGSVLGHELSHSVLAVRRGIPVQSITLFIFGGVSQISREADNPRTELVVALAGPLSSIVIGLIFLIIWFFSTPISIAVSSVAAYLGVINIFLALFNLIPGFPLDGGRVLRAIVWQVSGSQRRATRIAATGGRVVSYLFILAGIFEVLVLGNIIGGIWLAFIGWFLNSAAGSSYQQVALQDVLKQAEVDEVMERDFETVPPDMSVHDLVEEHVLRHGIRAFPVVSDSTLLGLITLHDVRHYPREQWPELTVGQVMTSRDKLHVATEKENLRDVVTLMDSANVNQLPVTDDGRIVGLVTRTDVVRFFAVRRELGMEEEETAEGSDKAA